MVTEETLQEINEAIGKLAIQLMDKIKEVYSDDERIELQGISNLGILFTGDGVKNETKRDITFLSRVFLHDSVDRVLGTIELHKYDTLR